jgi:NADPH:quinone reductase-like Zn-dependent oxidoreductase
MKAVCIHEFGGIDRMLEEDVPVPSPSPDQVLVRVHAAGVGPWDALVRTGSSELAQTLPLVLGSDFSGVVERVGANVTHLRRGEEVYGLTNDQFVGAYAEYTTASAASVARKPARLTHVEAASVPVIATTAWEMLFEHARVREGQKILVLGAAGNVGAYAVQLARQAGTEVIAVARQRDLDFVRNLNPAHAIASEAPFPKVDAVIDTAGGDLLARSYDAVVQGGIIVSSVEPPDTAKAASRGIRAKYFIVKVPTELLSLLADRLDVGDVVTNVGEVLGLHRAREAHEMLAGRPHRRGKIVLEIVED